MSTCPEQRGSEVCQQFIVVVVIERRKSALETLAGLEAEQKRTRDDLEERMPKESKKIDG